MYTLSYVRVEENKAVRRRGIKTEIFSLRTTAKVSNKVTRCFVPTMAYNVGNPIIFVKRITKLLPRKTLPKNLRYFCKFKKLQKVINR
jgi:hypothetical protein